MIKGDFFRVHNPSVRDPKRSRVFVVVSREVLIDSNFSTVICAPIYTKYHGLSTQVPVGIECGLKHECSINADESVSLPKAVLMNYVGSLSAVKIRELGQAMKIALDIDNA